MSRASGSDEATWAGIEAIAMVEAINSCERALRATFAQVRWLFFEPDEKKELYDGGMHEHAGSMHAARHRRGFDRRALFYRVVVTLRTHPPVWRLNPRYCAASRRWAYCPDSPVA